MYQPLIELKLMSLTNGFAHRDVRRNAIIITISIKHLDSIKFLDLIEYLDSISFLDLIEYSGSIKYFSYPAIYQ